VVLYLGVFSPRKGLDLLVESFAALDCPEAHLVLAGNDQGVAQALQRRIGELGLVRRVSFTGLLRGRDRLLALAGADAVVYPTRQEAFGLVPLEALLCGTPVVVNSDHGCGEVVAAIGGGLVVPCAERGRLTEAIARVLGDPGRYQREAAAAAGRIRERFTPGEVARQLEEIYAEVVA
jgi:glycosyltransferase involved in cell wall biosynthesis